MKRGRPSRTAAFTAFAVLVGCASVEPVPAPGWVDAPPTEPGFIYAVGNYVGSLYADDDLANALAKARGILSRNLQSRVVSDTSVRETESTSSVQSDVNVTSDYVVKNSEHIDTWTDTHGVRGRRGTVWVLMRVPKQ